MALIAREDRRVDAIDGASEFVPIPIGALLSTLCKYKRTIAWVTGIGMLVATGISLLIPNQYTSTAQLMPPDPRTFAAASPGLTSLAGTSSMSISSTASLLNQHTPAGTAIGILSSRDVLDDIINRFDLRRIYRCKLYLDARRKLLKNTVIEEDKKSGLVSIAVTDRDKYRAQQMVEAYIQDLNKIINSLSTSSARRERIFLEGRLKDIKDDLDTNARALSQFSSRNGTLDIAKQGEATVEAAARLQGELASAQSELSALEAAYTSENVRVQAARSRVNELQKQLHGIAGSNAGTPAGASMPSIRELPLLGLTYYDLSNKVTMQETLYETLSKEYELAKVREAEEIPPIKVLDEPDLPERKSKPHRSILVLMIGFLCFAGSCAWTFLREKRPNVMGEFLREG